MKFFSISRVRAHTQENRQKCFVRTRARNNSIIYFQNKISITARPPSYRLNFYFTLPKISLFVNLSKNDKFLLFISKTRFTFAYR